MNRSRIVFGAAIAALLLCASFAPPLAAAIRADEATDRIIVKFRDSAPRAQSASTIAAARDRVSGLALRTGVGLQLARSVSPQMHALHLAHPLHGDELQDVLARLARDPAVEYAVPDRRKYRAAVPNDPLYGPGQETQQWWLTPPNATLVSAIDAELAWDVTTGSTRIVVAVVDSGVLFDHPDLGRFERGGKLLPGYDMITDVSVANDGDGRDPDASDPGDWVTQADLSTSTFSGCDVADSSWHGTHIAGIIGAHTDNRTGVAGVGWSTWVLPVRVLGKCFGYDSDILAGIRWAAGRSVPGVPANPYPARVINLSLGSKESCTQPYLDAFSEIRPLGVLVVAAAGNDLTGASDSPANCPGVMSVTALRHVGTKVGFANWGSDVTIAAPGGNCVDVTGATCLYPIVSTANDGKTVPANMTYDGQVGTSFSTPMVAGVAGLMLAVNPYLNAAALSARLQASARPFPPPDPTLKYCDDPTFTPDASGNLPNDGQCNCTTTSCGAGMLDAHAAVVKAQNPFAAIAATAPPSPGSALALDGSPSKAALDAGIASYAWSVISSSPAGATIASPSSAQSALSFTGPGTYVVQLTVVDTLGRSDAQNCTVTVLQSGNTTQCGTSLPASLPADVQPPVQPPSSSGGGGGAIEGVELAALIALALGAGFNRRRRA
jgi:serine protease